MGACSSVLSSSVYTREPKLKKSDFKFILKYRIEQEIPRSSKEHHTFLVRAVGSEERRIAKKVPLRHENDMLEIYEYLNLLEDCDHPQIVPVLEWFRTDTEVQLIYPISPGAPVVKYFKEQQSISDSDLANITLQLVTVLNFVHKRRICVRDVNPQNLFFDGKQMYLTNLLTAKYRRSRPFNDFVGLPYLMSPEMAAEKYTRANDIWQAGVIIHLLATGSPIVDGSNFMEVAQKLNAGDFDIDKFKAMNINPELKEIVIKMLHPNPSHRIKSEEILKAPLFYRTQQANSGVFGRPSLLDNKLQKFVFQDDFHHGIHQFLVKYSSTDAEKMRALNEFRQLDLNNNGYLSPAEIKVALEKLGPDELETRYNAVLARMDTKGEQRISYQNFLEFWIDQETFYSEERLQKYFRMLDVNGNGFISEDEFIGALGSRVKEEDTRRALKKFSKSQGMDFPHFVLVIKEMSSALK